MITKLHAHNFVVVNNNDSGPQSLRAAIDSANNSPGHDTISFNIPVSGVIGLQSQLPSLDDPDGAFIDGFSQPGTGPGVDPPGDAYLVVALDGSNAGPSHGIVIRSSHNVVQGILIHNFEQDGIRIEAGAQGADSNHLFCNFVGVDCWSTTPMGNGTNQNELWAGVRILCPTNDSVYAYDNCIESHVISGNYADGVSITAVSYTHLTLPTTPYV
jgi:hypothetical protein